jgi:quercetin dioxygenase-like cupin family protein/quinol monooxygenase YgiN
MKKFKMSVLIMLGLFFIVPALKIQAQDAAKIDPEHYKVEVENDQVRVLRIKYGPGERSKMHSHPEGVVVFLSDSKGKMKTPDGKVHEMDEKAGKVMWTGPSSHEPANDGDKAFEVIQVELKNAVPGKKSLHLFELPEGVTEKELSDFLKEMNQAISEEGFSNAGYHLYKIPGENSENYQYFMEGVWPDSATYDKVHNSEKWKAMAEKGKSMIEKIQANELYLKAEKVE